MSESIRILHFSSRYEDCGVAKYLGHYIEGMKAHPKITNDYFEVSPYDTHNMKPADVVNMIGKLEKTLGDYDILHVQHEFALYAHDTFKRIVETGKKTGKKVVVTVHTSPALATKPVHLHGLGPRSIMLYFRQSRRRNIFINTNIKPLVLADIVIAHNDTTIDSLKALGVDSDKIVKTIHPVQHYEKLTKSSLVAKSLNKKEGDVIYCTIGFIHKYKGITQAIKALKFLPSNYKLAILGGMKEDSDDVAYYDKISDLIDTLDLKERVFISGYIKNDDDLNAMIRECDICVYPFDRVYYANVSSGSMNLAFANSKPVVAYPTTSIKEIASIANGALVLCHTFAYYELAREISQVNVAKQSKLSAEYANLMSWPKESRVLVDIYEKLVA